MNRAIALPGRSRSPSVRSASAPSQGARVFLVVLGPVSLQCCSLEEFVTNDSSLDARFHEAVAAIDAGDVITLRSLIDAHPALVRERLESPGAWLRDKVGGAVDGFFKRPYLLWFVAEDPVRNGTLPRN